MARPIKETPVLKGKDSDRFALKMAESEKTPVTAVEYKRIMANYTKVKAMFSK